VAVLVAGGVRPQDIGIITPYNAQVALLKELRPLELAEVEISSVDGFQGEPERCFERDDIPQ
jgi:superfamily I DNA and/or RNA helicase